MWYGTHLRPSGSHRAERAVLVMKEEFVSNGKERGNKEKEPQDYSIP